MFKTIDRKWRVREMGGNAKALSLVVACIALGCGGTVNNDGATKGQGGDAGASESGGAAGWIGQGSSAQTGGMVSDAGGTSNQAGGSAGTVETGVAGGTSCATPLPTLKCEGTAPPTALIASFALPAAPVFGTWGQSVFGGVYVYPSPAPAPPDPCDTHQHDFPLTSDVSGSGWHVTGQVGTYSGLGLWWGCINTTSPVAYAYGCTIDASAYTGMALTIHGSPVSQGLISLRVTSPATTPTRTDPTTGAATNCGTCGPTCQSAAAAVAVTDTPTTVRFTWEQLGVAAPEAIAEISMPLATPPDFDWTTSSSSRPYDLDIIIDDIEFTTD
jgi:hypothetical protein